MESLLWPTNKYVPTINNRTLIFQINCDLESTIINDEISIWPKKKYTLKNSWNSKHTSSQLLKAAGETEIAWLIRIFNVTKHAASDKWKEAIIIPVWKKNINFSRWRLDLSPQLHRKPKCQNYRKLKNTNNKARYMVYIWILRGRIHKLYRCVSYNETTHFK
jgi:hypothetical protein